MAQAAANKTSLRPLGNRVLVKRQEQEETLKGGILLPDSAKKKQETGKVIAVGPGKTTEDGTVRSMEIKVGDVILMDKYSGQEVTLDGEEFVIITEDHIIAIIN